MADKHDGYATTGRILHWTVALLVLLMIPAGLTMVQEGLSRPLQDTLFIFHKNTGVLVLLIVAVRVVYRLLRPAPPLPSSVPGWQKFAARLNHVALYVMLLVMPLSGYTRVRAGGFPIEALDAMGAPLIVPRSDALADTAKAIHFGGALVIIAAVSLHVAAALYHGLVRRDGVFSRMWPPLGRGRAVARSGARHN